VATPIIHSVGSGSGAGSAGQGRNDLVPGETVTLSDAEALNAASVYFWEFDDFPIGTAPVLLNPTTATPSFVVNPSALLAGSYRIRCTVDGAFLSVEVLAVPLATTGARIPSFEEETQYDAAGNVKGWHEAQTVFMRAVDATLGSLGSSANERSASVTVPNGGSSVELELGSVIYPGSLLAIGLRGEEPVTGGDVAVTVRINGVDQFTATLDLGSPDSAFSVQSAGSYPIVQGDRLSLSVVGAGLITGSATPLPVAINVAFSNTLTTDVLVIPDASNVQKGLTKLSIAPAVANEPVAAGTNDARIPTQDENNALVGTGGVPSSINAYVTNQDTRNTDSRTPLAHALGGALHSSSTLAELNAKISDTDAVDTADARIPTQDENDALVGTSGVPATGNKYVTDGDSRNTNSRAPTAHALAGALHSADTFTNFLTKITGAVPAATDLSQQYTANQRSAVVALTDAATVATDLALGNIFEVTLTATRILGNPTGIVKGMTWQVIVNQNGTGGFNLTYGGFYDWGDEGVPDLTTLTANKTAVLSFLALSATQIASTALKGFT